MQRSILVGLKLTNQLDYHPTTPLNLGKGDQSYYRFLLKCRECYIYRANDKLSLAWHKARLSEMKRERLHYTNLPSR